jgi:hypothetical protein
VFFVIGSRFDTGDGAVRVRVRVRMSDLEAEEIDNQKEFGK